MIVFFPIKDNGSGQKKFAFPDFNLDHLVLNKWY